MNKKQLISMWVGIACIVLVIIPFVFVFLGSYSDFSHVAGLVFLIFCLFLITIGFIITFKFTKTENEIKKPLNLKRGLKRIRLLIAFLIMLFFFLMGMVDSFDAGQHLEIEFFVVGIITAFCVWAISGIIVPFVNWTVKGFSQDIIEMHNVKKFWDSRYQHYMFVHQVLRDMFFDSPEGLMTILQSEDRNNSLLDLWSKVGDTVGKSRSIVSTGLCCEIHTYRDITIAVITLPNPKSINEAYYVALVYLPDRERALTRFITLEYSISSPAFCEWNNKGIHTILACKCEPTPEAFFTTVCEML